METKGKLTVLAACLLMAVVTQAGQAGGGMEIQSIAHATSAPLRWYAPSAPRWKPGMPPRVIPWRQPRKKGGPPGGGGGGGGGNWTDPDLQASSYSTKFSASVPFQGIGFTGDIPPDETLSVGVDAQTGQTQIVQIVNTSYAIYGTSGNALAGGGDLAATLFSALPSTSLCANVDGGDPIALFDTLDGRWLISQLAYNSNFTQNGFCLAISTNSDATGTYEVYDIPFGGDLPDYPKLAVWGDGIYFSANMFKLKVNPITGATSSTFLGAQACSFPRPSGTSPPSTVTFTCSGTGNTGIYNILPADLDGRTPPPSSAGSDYYLQFVDNLSATSGNELTLYQFRSGSLVALGNLTVGTFHEACGGSTCVPQLGTTQQLDSLGDRLMYRLSYRNYGNSQVMVVNQSVQASSASGQTGIRWYKLCNQSGTVPFYVCQESTFSPDTNLYRWMGSVAQNGAGDLGLAYSTSSAAAYPSVAVTGLKNGTENGLEIELQTFAGQSYQGTYSRWGDYSTISVDPKDDCTFWYTNEYLTPPVLGFYDFLWGTVIGSFTFPNCPANP